MTLNLSNTRFPMVIVMIALAIVAIIFLMATVQPSPQPDTSHAFLRHGSEADLGRECKGKGTLFYNPTTNRKANVCLTSAGFFGIWVSAEENGREVTSFVKNKMKRFEQIQQYMENAGYCIPKFGLIC